MAEAEAEAEAERKDRESDTDGSRAAALSTTSVRPQEAILLRQQTLLRVVAISLHAEALPSCHRVWPSYFQQLAKRQEGSAKHKRATGWSRRAAIASPSRTGQGSEVRCLFACVCARMHKLIRRKDRTLCHTCLMPIAAWGGWLLVSVGRRLVCEDTVDGVDTL